jgi:molecular chaperone DnaK
LIYGIDLGTSKCAVARYTLARNYQNCEPKIVKDEGLDSFPSVVFFKNENEYIVGKKALEYLHINPDSSVELVKIRIGRVDSIPVKINGKIKELNPQFISSLFIKHIKNMDGGRVQKAVLTVPAYFDQNQRQATLEAGEIAGFEIVKLVEEPSAALMYHLFYKYKNNQLNLDEFPQNYLVFDFGGGTLDLSLVRINLDKGKYIEPEVLLIGGDSELGGNLIDFEILKAVVNALYKTNKDSFITEVLSEYKYYYENYVENKQLIYSNGVKNEVKEFIARLKQNCEEAKIELSDQDSYIMPVGRYYKPVKITRQHLKEIINTSGIKDRIVQAINIFLNKNKENYPIDKVVLIGGASKIPYIKTILEVNFPQFANKIVYTPEFRECVCKGAAIMGAIEDGIIVPPFGANQCKSILANDIYIEHEGREELFISYGERYPFSKPYSYILRVEHSLKPFINIKFKEREFGKNKESLINDIKFFHPCFYTGDEIEINLSIDEKGIYRFNAVHVDTREKIEFESDKLFVLSDEEKAKYQQYVNRMREIDR